MRVLCIGGGPAGLYFGLLMKRQNPAHEVTVVERNRPYDTFGWGVVFSDATMANLREADPQSAEQIDAAFNHWDDIDIHMRGRTIRSGGHGFIGIGRKRLLNILQARCEALGVRLVFETDVEDDAALAQRFGADLVIASDGVNSRIRTRYADTFQPDVEARHCRFVWLGTHRRFDAFTFAFEQTEHGWFQAHAYRFDDDTSTFIVETPEAVWRAAGLDRMDQPQAIAFCERLFARYLDGQPLISNATHLRGSANWIRFQRVICRTWVHWNTLDDGRRVPVVLMGDAAHTAHFSIGSGTRLALEDGIDLANNLRGVDVGQGGAGPGLEEALQRYEATRSVEVLKIQNAARNSTEWFENVERYARLPVEQFAYSLLTRSQRISHENLRLRDPGYVAGYERWLAAQSGMAPDGENPPAADPLPPMLTPYRVRDLVLRNRVVVSPMAMYSCVDGVPGDFHLVHLGARATGGAALVMAEMTCVTPEGRITPGCPGLWDDAQRDAWRRIVDFVHGNSGARIGIQLGHSGRKGSTQLGWQRMDHPLPEGNWPLLSASPLPYLPGISQVPREMTRQDMDEVRDAFVAAARRAAEAGFDWLELHCAHGYLLSSFISPLTNLRQDEYGGSLQARLRYPLEVFAAVREVWPSRRPMSVRISAHDWVEGGITPDDAVEIARAFRDAGADMIDCSSGQVSPEQAPVYGRMYQTPFADRIRNEAGIATIAVGAITDGDQVDSIIAAGRADLCAIARPHLADPAWTLHQAARLGYREVPWPRPYLAGKRQLETLYERAAAQGVVA
ncbi:bifunctional salicylyl-CoA 5-hydroxylase/oxidoreductase [Cupriavidus sp. AU9028]|uniref:bifunctional salicylyl-CoA 5-hydroxylase/oxidoreductase n=1 Tax=Cupriavidus sp. AU9028 TaxID=2871157 RepID=UPI001C946251|nr:bifunctional salicylyl-CoA 5-hydroxylase/oxidoreductase [Cupriavidus sp. AU9028]MBY4896272.1 bifunctional salicylyl-CoA 5-hydroxylase/oxidoreductase [Cupriavidus sp. AU9028]